MSILVIIICISAYILGSIPSAVWIGKYFYGTDVRFYGSKNAGATNTFRVLGRTAGCIVLAADMAKGFIALKLGLLVYDEFPSYDRFKIFQFALGLIATLGHIYPLFEKFKGGKGVATMSGVLYAIFPWATLICTIIFLIVFLSTHYISLSSIISSIVYPFVTFAIYELVNIYLASMLLMIPVLIIYTHRQNIQRLIKGEEGKMYFNKKST